MDPYLAELSRTVPPAVLGRRLRAARKAAGLTQAHVAGGEVTAAYVSRIEGGHRRPDALLLERMAARAGITVHELLTGAASPQTRTIELRVEQAALALALGDPQAALTALETILAAVTSLRDPSLEAMALRVRADALRAFGDPEAAIDALEQVVASRGRDLNMLQALTSLCWCHCDRGDGRRAIATAAYAERLVADLEADGLAETLRLRTATAQAHLLLGNIAGAQLICAALLRDAVTLQSRTATAAAYQRASAAEATARGATPAAVGLARTARTLIELDQASRAMAAVGATVDSLAGRATDHSRRRRDTDLG